jgi:hypothetical protein
LGLSKTLPRWRRKWNVFDVTVEKLTIPVIEPHVKGLAGKRTMDEHIEVAIVVNINSGYRVLTLGRLECEGGIVLAREVDLHAEGGLTPPRRDQNRSVQRMIVVEVRNRESRPERRPDVCPRQCALQPVLRP